MAADPLAQDGAGVRFEWGHEGARRLGARCAVVAVVDVLSFTTAVTVAVERGAGVLPFSGDTAEAAVVARQHGAALAGTRGSRGPSLSPASLMAVEPGIRVLLPSPNGSTCCALAADAGATVVAGSLRNRRAVASFLGSRMGEGPVGVVAAGEQWPSRALRPALEDLLGAGGILALLDPERLSAEAGVAAAAFAGLGSRLVQAIADSGSGRELISRGFAEDVRLAAELDVSSVVPVLRDGVFLADG